MRSYIKPWYQILIKAELVWLKQETGSHEVRSLNLQKG